MGCFFSAGWFWRRGWMCACSSGHGQSRKWATATREVFLSLGGGGERSERSAGNKSGERKTLTLDLDRVPPSASIQTYSAMILPRWSRSRYFFKFSVYVLKDSLVAIFAALLRSAGDDTGISVVVGGGCWRAGGTTVLRQVLCVGCGLGVSRDSVRYPRMSTV